MPTAGPGRVLFSIAGLAALLGGLWIIWDLVGLGAVVSRTPLVVSAVLITGIAGVRLAVALNWWGHHRRAQAAEAERPGDEGAG